MPDVVFVTGDAYVDHPSFPAALLRRLLESEGFSVAVLSQPDWHSCEPWRKFGKPRLCFAIGAGNVDSMIANYTANKKVRNTDAYSPGGQAGRRPDRATIVYCQRAREAYKDVPIICGGVEASLRRIAHYDYWSDKVRRSIILDAKADLLVYGMGERALLEIVRRLAAGESVKQLRDIRGTAYRLGAKEQLPPARYSEPHWLAAIDAQTLAMFREADRAVSQSEDCGIRDVDTHTENRSDKGAESNHTVFLPTYEEVVADKNAFVEMTRVAHRETNPFNARRLVQYHGREAVVINPPQFPLTQAEMDRIYSLPFTRRPDPAYGNQHIPAYDVIKTSVQIVRGCFGGCAFCSLGAHEGKIVQSRSKESVLEEIRSLAKRSDFTGTVSDLGGPTANMYGMGCRDWEMLRRCRRLSCLYPSICPFLNADHGPLLQLMKAARSLPGVRKVLIASGIRMDLALLSPEYIRELAKWHVGGHLKVAPEHTHPQVLRVMRKPSAEVFDRFAQMFRQCSVEAGKEQYLVPYFIAGHPGCDLNAMIDLAVYLKRTGYRPQQVQDFIPAPFDLATCMYYTGIDPITRKPVYVPRGQKERRLQRALLQFWKPENYFDVREVLTKAGRTDLVGSGPDCLIPAKPPAEARRIALKRKAKKHRSGSGIDGSQASSGKRKPGYRPRRRK